MFNGEKFVLMFTDTLTELTFVVPSSSSSSSSHSQCLMMSALIDDVITQSVSDDVSTGDAVITHSVADDINSDAQMSLVFKMVSSSLTIRLEELL